MNPKTQEVVKALRQLPQRQDALSVSSGTSKAVANRLGMYDAADFLRTALEAKR